MTVDDSESADPTAQAEQRAYRLGMYQAIATRRTQFDNLMWQVPILSITAQAFLFTVSLGSDSSQVARIISAALSLVVTILTLQLFVRHRQSEITDAHWLEAREMAEMGSSFHGRSWQHLRNEVSPAAGPFNALAKLGGYRTWSIGLCIFGIASLMILTIAIAAPQLLQGTKG